MKRTRFTEADCGHPEAERSGFKTAEICRQNGISEATFYNWKAKYGGMAVSDVQKLKRLEEENAKLKRVVADLTLDNVLLKDLLSENFWNLRASGPRDSRDEAAWNQRTPRLQVDTVGALHATKETARQCRRWDGSKTDGTCPGAAAIRLSEINRTAAQRRSQRQP
jgi:putative transposase